MKRESKAYSFKEQQEEIQLRKELEEKKKKAGLIKAPELSEKQKEVMRVELEKEAAIRMKLMKVSPMCVVTKDLYEMSTLDWAPPSCRN